MASVFKIFLLPLRQLSVIHFQHQEKMNALTQIKNTQLASKQEIELGLVDSSWHDRFKHSAYVYVGGLPFELTEGDILAVCSQYGEIVDVHLVKDGKTKKSRGFAFVAYEDQRSTVLAVDNLSGSRVGGRTIRVEHVDNYRKAKREADGDSIDEDSSPDDEDGGVQEDVNVEADQHEETLPPAQASAPSWRDLVARREKKLEKKERKRKHRTR